MKIEIDDIEKIDVSDIRFSAYGYRLTIDIVDSLGLHYEVHLQCVDDAQLEKLKPNLSKEINHEL